MKKIFFTLFILFVLFHGRGIAQVNWIQLNSGTNQELYSTVFIDDQTGYIAGGNDAADIGILLKTNDAGNTWSQILTGSGQFSGVSFPSANVGYVCSWHGVVTKTTDAGSSWTSFQVTNAILNDIKFIDNNTGFTIGRSGAIYKTVNGGVSWTAYESSYEQDFTGLFFVDVNTGYVCGNFMNGGGAVLLKTTNAGGSWTSYILPFHRMLKGFFLNVNTGFAIGMISTNNPAIWKTTNGGATWEAKLTGFDSEPEQIYFSNSNIGVVAACGGKIFRTINGGENWTLDNTGTMQSLFGICIANNGIGYAAGMNGTVLKSTNFNYTYCGNGTHKVYICHNGHTICVDTNAVQAHLNHGDYLGLCNENVRSSEVEVEDKIIRLYTNYPNPFNPSTKIKFYLPDETSAKLTIYDVTGKEVLQLVDNVLKAGEYEFEWDAVNYSSGIYYYKLTAGETSEIKRMVLIK